MSETVVHRVTLEFVIDEEADEKLANEIRASMCLPPIEDFRARRVAVARQMAEHFASVLPRRLADASITIREAEPKRDLCARLVEALRETRSHTAMIAVAEGGEVVVTTMRGDREFYGVLDGKTPVTDDAIIDAIKGVR